MSHHHYEDVIDPEEINREIKRLEKKKEEITKNEKNRNQRAIDLSTELQDLKFQRDSINSIIFSKQLELNKLCTHEKIRTEERNYPGSYLDKSEHHTDYFCEICGVKVDEKVSYGSFG